MRESTSYNSQQIPVEATLDVQDVERQLNELWTQNAGASDETDEGAMLRARVLNLMVYMTDDVSLSIVDDMLMEVATVHPCRALVMIGEADGEDSDIEVVVASRCQLGRGAGGQHLCSEEVTLRAKGRFAVELPSASVPLLVSDLPVFVWWNAAAGFGDPNFESLARASDRVIIDTARFRDPALDFRALAGFLNQAQGSGFGNPRSHGLSDLNWARLTSWRTLLASFYDAPVHAEALLRLNRVRVDYVAPGLGIETVAPKALLLVGWLASRLGWRASPTKPQTPTQGTHLFCVEKDGLTITVELRPTEHSAVDPGGITRVELTTESVIHKTFVAMRAEDCRDFQTWEASDAKAPTPRVVSGADKSESELFAAELEILSHDRIYEETIVKAVELFCGS